VIYLGKKDCQKYGRDAISDLEIDKSYGLIYRFYIFLDPALFYA